MQTGSDSSRIGFVTEGGDTWPVWDRYLTLDGKKAFNLGNICQTCEYLFERMDGANKSINFESTVDALATGIRSISGSAVTQIGDGLPKDNYEVCLLDATLHLVRPGDPDDYFVKELVALWGIEKFWDLPHNPRVPYYRAGEKYLEKGKKLFQFVIPMFPESWLDTRVVMNHVTQMEDGNVPTAVAVSLLDVKGPADWEGDVDPTEHWVLSHFLIDGHHKVRSARESGHPIRILSFISSRGISTNEDIAKVIKASAG